MQNTIDALHILLKRARENEMLSKPCNLPHVQIEALYAKTKNTQSTHSHWFRFGLDPIDFDVISFNYIGSALLNFLLPGFTTGVHYRVLITDVNNCF